MKRAKSEILKNSVTLLDKGISDMLSMDKHANPFFTVLQTLDLSVQGILMVLWYIYKGWSFGLYCFCVTGTECIMSLLHHVGTETS